MPQLAYLIIKILLKIFLGKMKVEHKADLLSQFKKLDKELEKKHEDIRNSSSDDLADSNLDRL